eukprot:1139009-Pelagomonas_calceolata.AAC.1
MAWQLNLDTGDLVELIRAWLSCWHAGKFSIQSGIGVGIRAESKFNEARGGEEQEKESPGVQGHGLI